MSESTIDPNQYRLHDKDTGSADYQVALLSQRIKHLTDHMGSHRKDFSSRRGLLTLVARRRKLLDFLEKDNEERYQKIVAGLGLRR
jgi:small subunit ribosomal protein S15